MNIIIKNITDEKIAQALQLIRNNGGTVSGASFAITGVFGSYAKSGNDLIVTIDSKPFYISNGMIESKLKEFFN